MYMHCLRCDYKWESRASAPRACPFCKSYKWDVPRKASTVSDPKNSEPLGQKIVEEFTKEVAENFPPVNGLRSDDPYKKSLRLPRKKNPNRTISEEDKNRIAKTVEANRAWAMLKTKEIKERQSKNPTYFPGSMDNTSHLKTVNTVFISEPIKSNIVDLNTDKVQYNEPKPTQILMDNGGTLKIPKNFYSVKSENKLEQSDSTQNSGKIEFENPRDVPGSEVDVNRVQILDKETVYESEPDFDI
jgi:hypothetical protein